MSWGALPWWVYQVEYENLLMEMSCAFPEECMSGTSKELPDHVIKMHPSDFSSHNFGGWNHEDS